MLDINSIRSSKKFNPLKLVSECRTKRIQTLRVSEKFSQGNKKEQKYQRSTSKARHKVTKVKPVRSEKVK